MRALCVAAPAARAPFIAPSHSAIFPPCALLMAAARSAAHAAAAAADAVGEHCEAARLLTQHFEAAPPPPPERRVDRLSAERPVREDALREVEARGLGPVEDLVRARGEGPEPVYCDDVVRRVRHPVPRQHHVAGRDRLRHHRRRRRRDRDAVPVAEALAPPRARAETAGEGDRDVASGEDDVGRRRDPRAADGEAGGVAET